MRRVVDKLLHAPTVRVKQLAAEPGGAGYANTLRTLFDLDPERLRASVSRAENNNENAKPRASMSEPREPPCAAGRLKPEATR